MEVTLLRQQVTPLPYHVVGREIARIEQDIRQKVPEARHVDIVHSIADPLIPPLSPPAQN